MSPQLEGLGPKAHDLIISSHIAEGENLPQFHLIDLHTRSEIFLSQDKTGQINNLTGKYIMEMTKWKHLQRYMTPYKIYYREFECQTQSHQLSTASTSTIEEVFETLDTVDIDMESSHSMIEPIFNRNFSNTFQHQNEPNQRQLIHKHTGQQYQ